MYYGSDEFNNAIENTQGNALKTRLKFSDEEIIELISSMRYYGGSNDTDDLSIGNIAMAYIEVSAFTNKMLTGREFLLESGVKLSDGTYEYAPIGYFTVQTPSGDYDEVSFTAYDRMIKFEKVYSSSLTYPTDSAKVLNEICTICGVELATPIKDPITITENLKGYTCREVLSYIAGIHGFFACIDRFGKLNLRWYSDTPITKSLKTVWAFEKSQEQYEVEKVEVAKDSETSFTSGNGIITLHHSNPYATQEITDNLFIKLDGYAYMPAEIEMLDDIRLDPWDVISVTYYDGIAYLIPCMSIIHDFGATSTTIRAVGKTSTENEYRFTGPTIQYLNRMATDLLVANRVIATKVDAEYVQAHAITVDNLDVIEASIKSAVIKEVQADFASIDYLEANYADIQLANVEKADIGTLLASIGLIDRATIVDGHVTGYLDSVEVNANKITVGTLAVDRLVFRGENSIIYELNNVTGALQAVQGNTLNGEILTDRSITVDKIVANSITANELDVTNIFGNSAVLKTLTTQEAFINAISTNKIVVGANNKADEALETAQNSYPLIKGTQTSATGSWTGKAPFNNLVDGQKISYALPYNGSGNATLNLTLSDGSTTGALPIYYNATSRLTTQYSAGAVITLTYRKDVKIGSATYTGWWTTIDSNTYDRTRYSSAIKASSAITAGNIIVGNASGYHHLKTGGTFDISYPILYAGSAITSGSTGTNNYLVLPFAIATTQSLALTAYKAVYIKGKLNGSIFTPVSTAPLTQSVPTSDDGYYYILLGTAYSTTSLYLLAEHPIYRYKNGAFKTTAQIAAEIAAWAYNNNATYIDGGNIYANTITADKINVADLFAQDILATGSITGVTLNGVKGFIGNWEIADDGLRYEDGVFSVEISPPTADNGNIALGFSTYDEGLESYVTEGYVGYNGKGYPYIYMYEYIGNFLDVQQIDATTVTANFIRTKAGADLDTINSNLNNRGYSRIIARNIPENTVKTATVEDLNNFKYILARIVTSGGAVPIIVPTELALYDKLEYANSFHSTSGNIISISIKAVSNTQLQVWGNCTGYNFTKIEVLGVY